MTRTNLPPCRIIDFDFPVPRPPVSLRRILSNDHMDIWYRDNVFPHLRYMKHSKHPTLRAVYQGTQAQRGFKFIITFAGLAKGKEEQTIMVLEAQDGPGCSIPYPKEVWRKIEGVKVAANELPLR